MKLRLPVALIATLTTGAIFAQTNVPLDEQLNALRERAKAPIEEQDWSEPEIQEVTPAPAVPPTPPPQSPAQVAPPAGVPVMAPTLVNAIPAALPPQESEIHAGDAEDDSARVWVLDPRKSLLDEVVSSGFEPTSVYVQRALYIAGTRPDASPEDAPEWVQKLPVDIPVMHRTRYVKLDDGLLSRAKNVLKRMQALKAKADEMQKESEELLKEWNSIVSAGTPNEILMPESPSLTTNQGGEINVGKPAKGFEVGKEVTFTIE